MRKESSMKYDFACVLAGEESKMMNDCERYGMMSGCDEGCPVLQAGKCELQEENKHQKCVHVLKHKVTDDVREYCPDCGKYLYT